MISIGRRAALFCLLGLSFVAGTARAAPEGSPREASARFGLEIRAGLPLDEALQELAGRAGVQLVFFSQITAGRSAPALSGEYTLSAALTRLLEGSGLTFRAVNEHTIEVRQPPARVARPAISSRTRRPTPPKPEEAMEEVQVVGTVEQLVATRVPTPLAEIPQTLSVVSARQIHDQNSFELVDVLRNAVGLATRRTDSLDERAYSRAFEIDSYHVDGGGALKPRLPEIDLYAGSPDMSEFDRVEVLRGSDALFSANTNPGGTVSLVRKRPLATPQLDASVLVGSWNTYRVQLDATGPLREDGSLRGRFVGVYGDRDFFFETAHAQRRKVFGALEYDITPAASVTVGGSYQWDDALPVLNGMPTYVDGLDTRLPRSTGLTTDWAFYNTRSGNAYLQYRQYFSDDWFLKLNASVGRTRVEYGYAEFPGSVQKARVLTSPAAFFSLRPDRHTLAAADATLTGELEWFGLHQQIAVGGDFTRIKGRQTVAAFLGVGPNVPLDEFDPAAYPDPRGTRASDLGIDALQQLDQYGAFVSLEVDLGKAWSVTGGVRHSSDRYHLGGVIWLFYLQFPDVSNEYRSHDVSTPFAALLYRINEHFNWYFSYADVYLTLRNSPLRANGELLGPARGANFESGIKGTWRDGALNALLVVYRIQQRNLPLLDETVQDSPLPNCCFRSGTGRSRGAELQLDGELTPGWLIGGGYTFNLLGLHTGSLPVTSTPRHLLKVWTSKRLPDPLSRWTLGGALRAQTPARGSRYIQCAPGFVDCTDEEAVGQKKYAVLDLRAAFDIDTNWQVALSVNNVLDKRYYLSQDTPGNEVWYGEPRNFMLRIDSSF